MRLQPAPKYAGAGPHRTIPPAETLRRARPAMRLVGITRLADLTHLDRVGIPVYGAIVPDSPDALSVYNGKGATKLDAKAGAVMEAIERHAALTVARDRLTWPAAARAAVLDPSDLILPLHPGFSGESRHALVEGFDLVGGAPILVPAQAVGIRMLPEYGDPCYAISTTNGLASGNTLEEAICHALCELVERDAWTLAELRARHLPEQLRRHHRWSQGADDDLRAFPDVDLTGAPHPIGSLARRFAGAGVSLRLKDVTSDVGIATVMATTLEHAGPTHAMAHVGLGTHPDARVAITRALTEVAQCRAVDVQAVREDLTPAGDIAHPFAPHTRRVMRVRPGSWYHRRAPVTRSWTELPHREHRDALEDITLLLERLTARGLDRVIAVDITEPDVGIPVVRVLVPGIESWAADGGRVGQRADAFWRSSQLTVRGAASA